MIVFTLQFNSISEMSAAMQWVSPVRRVCTSWMFVHSMKNGNCLLRWMVQFNSKTRPMSLMLMIVELNVNTNRPAALAPVLCDTLSSIPFLFMIERAWPTHHLHCMMVQFWFWNHLNFIQLFVRLIGCHTFVLYLTGINLAQFQFNYRSWGWRFVSIDYTINYSHTDVRCRMIDVMWWTQIRKSQLEKIVSVAKRLQMVKCCLIREIQGNSVV